MSDKNIDYQMYLDYLNSNSGSDEPKPEETTERSHSFESEKPLRRYEEEPVEILDKSVKKLRNKTVPMVKVLWRNHSTEEATWETEEAMRTEYPHLFT